MQIVQKTHPPTQRGNFVQSCAVLATYGIDKEASIYEK